MSGYYHLSGADRYTKTISITSGKGGVGKTSLICNLALSLANKGNRVLILDGDLGMANVDIMFNKRAEKNLQHLLSGQNSVSEIITSLRTGIDLISGGSGVYELQNLNSFEKRAIFDQLESLKNQYNYMLIDTAPGIADNVLYLNAAAEEILIVLTPDPSSMTDAYALIKVLNTKYKINEFSVVSNLMTNEREGLLNFKKLSDICLKFLSIKLNYKGFVPMDLNLRRSTKSQQLVLNYQPRSPSSFAVRQLAENIKKNEMLPEIHSGVQAFWGQLIGVA